MLYTHDKTGLKTCIHINKNTDYWNDDGDELETNICILIVDAFNYLV
jgi:hypothetical protein